MERDGLFRKVALERLASPEQLDQLTQVTNGRAWVALAACGLLLAAALTWGVLGRLPESVSGTGMLIKSGGVLEVVSPSSGRVSDIAVSVGDVVREGQVIARVDQPDLSDQLQQARAALAHLRAEHVQTVAFNARDAEIQRRYLGEQRASTEQQVAADERSLAWLASKITAQEQLVKQGLLTNATLISTRQQYDQTSEKIADGRSQLTQVESKLLSLSNSKQDQQRTSQQGLQDAERKVAELERALRDASEIVTPYAGRILEVMSEQGGIANRGDAILSLVMTGRTVKGLEAVVYVPPTHGKQIKPGMTIQIAPSTVKQEEYGLMLGRVTYVSDFPATPRGIQRVLKNQQLVQSLSGGSAPYEVHADLTVDPTTVSRFRWTSAGGPPIEIKSGTLATGNIEIASRMPIAMVIPILREYTGI